MPCDSTGCDPCQTLYSHPAVPVPLPVVGSTPSTAVRHTVHKHEPPHCISWSDGPPRQTAHHLCLYVHHVPTRSMSIPQTKSSPAPAMSHSVKPASCLAICISNSNRLATMYQPNYYNNFVATSHRLATAGYRWHQRATS